MARTRTTVYAVLGMLSIEPMSGYDMKKFAGESIGHFWSESYGQLYPTLRELERGGLVAMETERREGGTDRKVYRLTEAGLEELRRWIVRPVERRPVRDELLLKLFFGRHVGAEHLRATVEQMRGEQERALGALRVAEGEISEEREHPDFPYWMMTLRFGLDMGEAYLRWCDETLAELRALERVEEGSKR